jgi:hypothetical protein
MSSIPPNVMQDEARLGALAMRFRGTRRDAEREAIAKEYCETVQRLIQSGQWEEMPPHEDQLPDERMPPAFFDYWSIHQTSP